MKVAGGWLIRHLAGIVTRQNAVVNNTLIHFSSKIRAISALLWWLGGVAIGRWTRDQEVAGSTLTAALFGQQPWASCSHLMCLCSPSSIIWYLARAFILKAPYCWQRHRVQWTRGYCRAVLRWSSDCIEPRYKSSTLPFYWPVRWYGSLSRRSRTSSLRQHSAAHSSVDLRPSVVSTAYPGDCLFTIGCWIWQTSSRFYGQTTPVPWSIFKDRLSGTTGVSWDVWHESLPRRFGQSPQSLIRPTCS